MYIYIVMYNCMNIYMCIDVYIYIYIHTYKHIYIYREREIHNVMLYYFKLSGRACGVGLSNATHTTLS